MNQKNRTSMNSATKAMKFEDKVKSWNSKQKGNRSLYGVYEQKVVNLSIICYIFAFIHKYLNLF